jgi:hypothetical protein
MRNWRARLVRQSASRFMAGLADFTFRRYVSRAIGRQFRRDHQGEGSMTSSRRPVEGIA